MKQLDTAGLGDINHQMQQAEVTGFVSTSACSVLCQKLLMTGYRGLGAGL